MNPLKKLFGQTAIYGLGTIVPRFLHYVILTPLYTRIFMPGEYGSYTELYAYVAFFLALLSYGMETTYFRFVSDSKQPHKVYSTALVSLFVTSAVFLISVYVFKNHIAATIKYSDNPQYILYLAIIIAVEVITYIPFAKLRHENKALRFVIIKIINVVVTIALIGIFYWSKIIADNPADIDTGIKYIFISNIVAITITLILLIPEIFKIKLVFDLQLLKKMLAYAYPLLIISLAYIVNEVADKVFIKYLTPEKYKPLEQVGIYGANYKVAVLMTIFIQMFRYAAEPFFFSQAKEKNSEKTYADVMKYFIIFGLFIFLGVMLYLDIIKYFIGERFHEGLAVIPIVLIANLNLGIFYNLSVWYKLKNITKYGAIIAITGAIITISLNIILIPRIGYMGSAWATFACYTTMTIISYFWGRRFFKINYDLVSILKYTIITGILFFVKKYVTFENQIYNYSLSTLLFLIFIIIVIYSEKLYRIKNTFKK